MTVFENEDGHTVIILHGIKDHDLMYSVASSKMMDDTDEGELCMQIIAGMDDIASTK